MPNRSVLSSSVQDHPELAHRQDAVEFQNADRQHLYARMTWGHSQTNKLQSRQIRRVLLHPPTISLKSKTR